MKYILKLFFSFSVFVLWSKFAYNQQVTTYGGDHYQTDSGQFSATIGESVIKTLDGNHIFTQVFQLSKYTITDIYHYKSFDKKFSIYPNPLKDDLMISVNDDAKVFNIIVLDELGVDLGVEKLTIGRTANSIDFSSHRPGIYFIRILKDKSLVLQSFKVVKL